MPGDTGVTVQPATLSRSGLRRVLAVLCICQITTWGILFYAFPVLALRISGSTGWSLPWVVASFTLGQLIAALVGIPVGRWLDRSGPRPVMTAGSVLAVPALVVIAWAPELEWFLVGWAVAGVAMGAVLYPPAFAALTRWYGPRRVTALTVLTLVAGLASTVFAPMTALLTQVLGRLGYTTLTRRTSVRARTTIILLATAATTAVLALLTTPTALIIAAVAAGMARGVFTLLQATAITDRWGPAHYGRLNGLLSAPMMITAALAPWAGAALAALLGGYPVTFLVLAALNLAAVALALATMRPRHAWSPRRARPLGDRDSAGEDRGAD